jgi:hypothetical protein
MIVKGGNPVSEFAKGVFWACSLGKMCLCPENMHTWIINVGALSGFLCTSGVKAPPVYGI